MNTKQNKPVPGTPIDHMKKFGGQKGGQNFKDGRHDRNGIDRSIYTGCCDAARDGFTGNKFEKYQEISL